MKNRIAFALIAACLAAVATADEPALYKDSSAPVEARVDDLLKRLTLEEKANICHGNFTSGGIPRLGIRPLLMLDGRQGLRPVDDDRGTKTTLLPCALNLSCTWDVEAAREFGGVLAEEMLAFRRHVLLAPMLNLVRSPLAGRNFENFGEDPLLTGEIGAAYIKGVQKKGVGACACLLVANDCEQRRHFTSSNMTTRTLRELHIIGYEMAAREADVWTMMSGNNLYNGVYCAQNRGLIQGLMKDEFGYDGVMITDWRAAYETVPTALAGTDMATGICSYVFGNGNLLKAVKSGDVPESLLDEKARRVLRLYVRSGVLDPEDWSAGALDSPAHREAARRLAAEGMVLLKNERGALPLEPGKVRRILVTGPGADVVIQGGGSGSVPAAINVTPLQGIREAFGSRAEVSYLPLPVKFTPGVEKGAVEWDEQTTKGAGKKRAAKAAATTLDELTSAARSADVVIFVAAGMQSSEGRDLPDMELPGRQAQAIAAVADANPRTIVALAANGAVNLDGWADKSAAIIAMHYAGEATGHALADIITGAVNPSGKLSYTLARKLQDYPCHALGEWPAKLILPEDPKNPGMTPAQRKPTHAFTTEYNEGVFAGYRWLDEKKIEPAFAFGYGLSYTSFTLENARVTGNPREGFKVTCDVKNTGEREGAEVVQVYVAPPENISQPRPPKELKGFARISLKPGETKAAEIGLRPAALASFHEKENHWITEPGDYQVLVGTSSRDIKEKLPLKVAETIEHEHY